ncbi:tyrosine-protein phosphatase [Allostreptomyces psammosilenae]|uniref:Protein-tyrosine phosphatase n=1 Tax=Allostreptomyces psammosilenae TaxID=1892865 RepID=A0A853A0A6_9ACTN|nr:tyrosine-protein phosphatase [Allostreptomyces psammosilenae]NYI06364.1 protein-tyrosine phosphatase [Allostreptomyces psammosilenae]
MTRHITFERLHNFRDLGGYRSSDGQTVRWGRLFRSDSLGKLRGEDFRRFLALDVATVIDLRYPWEIEARGRVPEHPSLTYRNLSIEHRPYDQAALGPEVAAGRYLADRYLEVAHDGVRELGRALAVIAAEDGPVVFHCASGKDRTGLLAALVLSLLGVDEADIVEDFTLTERATGRLVADWRADHPGRELTWPDYGRAPAEVMRLFLADLTERHGSVRRYAADLLGADDAVVAALRRRLLEPAEHPAEPARPADPAGPTGPASTRLPGQTPGAPTPTP